MPHFSVIMPLYNKAPYVHKAVESVVGQTYGDWELVVVDDGSTDGGGEVVKAISDNRIRLVGQENAGVGAARNRGVAESTAQYLCFLDADDWWEPTFLEEMAGLIERHPDAGIYGTGYYIVKNGRKRVAPIGVDDGFTEGEINYCRVYAKTLCMPLWTGAVCMPRAAFDEQHGFKSNIDIGEDFDLWIRIALSHIVVLINKALSNYNQDVNPAYRGTHRGKHHPRNPDSHYLWNIDYLAEEEKTNKDYKLLIDKLRAYTLVPYYLDRKLRGRAKTELKKIRWNALPNNLKRQYQTPIPILKVYLFLINIAVKIKNKIWEKYLLI